MDKIMLNDLLRIPENQLVEYKIKLNMFDKSEEPLNVFVRSRKEFESWISFKKASNVLSRKYVIALVQYYVGHKEQWLFAGVYLVKNYQKEIINGKAYDLEELEVYSKYVGRLLLKYKNKSMNIKRYAENVLPFLEVTEILTEKYNGTVFTGYDNIKLSFSELEHIIKSKKIDWYTATSNLKGVYLIADKSNGMLYVGAAYGSEMIWGRWSDYIYNGHGDNVYLKHLINYHGIEYARDNFQFTILEYFRSSTDENIILKREAYWKTVLLSNAPNGYN